MKHRPRALIVSAAIAVNAACMAEPTPHPRVEAPTERVTVETKDSMPPEHTDVNGLAVYSRGPRRLSVSQIERSFEAIGGLPRGSVELDASLAQTLGEPDFFRVTEESLDPSPLFMKFMLDLGAFACNALSDLDSERPIEDRVLTRYADVEENIRYILLRFTGIDGAAADEYVPRLAAVYEGGQAAGRPNAAWAAVCLAVFTSPEFLLY